MCTVSWILDKRFSRICFNRDEQRLREAATPPAQLPDLNVPTLAPIDPESGGTWISAAADGRVACLLNNYDAAQPADAATLTSRGHIITKYAAERPANTLEWLTLLTGEQVFAPFHLLFFTPGPELQVYKFTWSGNTIEQEELPNDRGMFTTSGWNADEVVPWRHQLWEKAGITDHRKLADFHMHRPPRNGRTVWMSRQDAQTVSFSQVDVRPPLIEFNYTPLWKVHGRTAHRAKLNRIRM